MRCCLLVALLLLAGAGTANAAPVLAGPPGGGVRDIVVAPSNGRVAYASTSGSLFLTRDGGRHWRLIPERLMTPLNLFAVDPARPSVVYASAGHSEAGERLVVSRDAGLHWRLLGRLHAPGLGPGWLVVDPRGRDTLYQELWSSIYRSTDGGRRWRRIPPVGALSLDPRGVLILGAKGLHRSRDRGRTWRRVHAGVRFVRTLVADPKRAGTLYILVDGGDAPGIRRSRNGGATWTPVAHGYFDQLVIDRRAPSTLYGTTQIPAHLLRTINGGRTWQAVDHGLGIPERAPGFAFGPLALGAGRPARVYVSTGEGGGAPGGVHVSTDRGRRWRPTGPGLVSSTVIAAATAPRCPARLYAATGLPDFPAEGSHLYASGDGARRWTRPAVGPPATRSGPSGPAVFTTSLAVDARAPTTAYAGANTGVWRTTDAGRHWARLESGPASVDVLAADPRHPSTVYASTRGVPDPLTAYANSRGVLRVTRDGGGTWADTGLSLPGAVGVTAMAFDPRRPSVLYAATRAPSDDDPNLPPRVGDGVYRSTDAGTTWTLMSTGLGDLHIGALALDPRHPSTLYAATESHGLYRSRNAGLTWQRVGPGPIRGWRRVNVLSVDPATSRVYGASGPGAGGNPVWGLWGSGDGGRSWSQVAPNVLHAPVSGIAIDATGRYLDAATHGLGVVRIPLRSGPAPRCRS